MKNHKINNPLLIIIRKLSRDQITGAETLFLYRSLKCKDRLDSWTKLADIYQVDEMRLHNIEKIVLRRLALDRLLDVESWLTGWWAGEDYVNKLTPNERVNLDSLVKKAIALHTSAANRKESRPAPVALLAGEETEQWAMLEKAFLTQQSSRQQSGQVAQPLSLQKNKAQTLTSRPVDSSPLHGTSQRKAIQTSDPNLVSCPSSIMQSLKQPEKFLETLINLHTWLNESPRKVIHLRQFVAVQWQPMNYIDFQKAMDLFYSLGMIGQTTGIQPDAVVPSTLSTTLNVSQFRRTCAEKFTRRVQGNDVLLAAIDYLDCACLEQLKRAGFGNKLASELIVRLMLWEALGIVQRQGKDAWKITQAGRALVASLPRVQPISPASTEPAMNMNDDDWLDVL